jgi:copper chaperone
MTTTSYKLQTLTCPSCIVKIEKALGEQPGVKDAKVYFNSSKVKVSHNEDADTSLTKKTIENLGYEVLDEK